MSRCRAAVMMRMYAAAMAALVVSPVYAVPAAGLTFEQSLAVSSPLSQNSYAAVENKLSDILTKANGVQTTATVVTRAANRRLQVGTTLSISYTVQCGSECEAVAAVRPSNATSQNDSAPPLGPPGSCQSVTARCHARRVSRRQLPMWTSLRASSPPSTAPEQLPVSVAS